MAYSMNIQLTGPMIFQSVPNVVGTTAWYFLSLADTQKVAELLGDGFYAEELNSEDGMYLYNIYSNGDPVPYATSGNVHHTNPEAMIPVLRHEKYGNVGIVITSGASSGGRFGVNFVDVVTGDFLGACTLGSHNNGSGTSTTDVLRRNFGIINMDADKKLLVNPDVTISSGAVILCDDCIFHCRNCWNSGKGVDVISVKDVEIEVSTTQYQSSLLTQRPRNIMVPFNADELPDSDFSDKHIYIMIADTGNYAWETVVYGGVRYLKLGFTGSVQGTPMVVTDEGLDIN